MVEIISHKAQILDYIVPSTFDAPGISFFTPNEFSQQLAYMHHPAGKIIKPHIHNPVQRSVAYTLEVLFIRKVKLRVDAYDDNKDLLGRTVRQALRGGHGRPGRQVARHRRVQRLGGPGRRGGGTEAGSR